MSVGKQYCIYIMTNTHNTVLYTGMTNDLARRVYEHKNGLGGIFTRKYNVQKLVYYEVAEDVNTIIAREKQIKGGSRKKKIELIKSLNPEWKDLYEEIILMSLRGTNREAVRDEAISCYRRCSCNEGIASVVTGVTLSQRHIKCHVAASPLVE